MYNIMIVDDEPAIRKGLASFVDWRAHDCMISAVATDGVDAVEKLQKGETDIVVTDIKMPEMDGIELCKHIYDKYPHIKTIILTAYDEFDYSQSAIRYGVVDFVLKLTSTEKIIDAVEKAKTIISRERENAARIKELEGELLNQTKEVQEHLLLNLLKRIETDRSKIVKRMDLLDIRLSRYCAAVLSLDDDSTGSNVRSLYNLISSMLSGFRHYIAAVSANQLCIFIELEAESGYEDNTPKLFSIFSELVYIISNLEKAEVNIGISAIHSDVYEIPEAYGEAMLALTDRFYNKAKVHIHSGSSSDSLSSNPLELREQFDRIIEYARSGMMTELGGILGDVFESFKAAYASIETIKSLSMQLLAAIDGMTFKNGHFDTVFSAACNDRYSGIWHSKSAADIRDILEKSILNAVEPAGKFTNTNNTVIKKIDKYILSHYGDEINLTTISNHVHMNSSYLSRLYKKETGMNINEKISNIRIERAKELLNNTDMKIYEIADQVGIKNPTYFSILFKKYTGQYPNNYKSLSISKS